MSEASIRTQISSKYSPDNHGLFPFKQLLKAAGVEVSYPVGDSIIEYSLGFAITVDQERSVSFPLTEIDFLESIRHSNVQVTYNVHGANEGYLGESTAIETAYALQCNVPVVLVRPITSFSDSLDPEVRLLFERVADDLLVVPLDRLSPSQARIALAEAILAGPTVYLLDEERQMMPIVASMLTNKYAETWWEYSRNEVSS